MKKKEFMAFMRKDWPWVYLSSEKVTKEDRESIVGKWVIHNHPAHLISIAQEILFDYLESGEIKSLKMRVSYNDRRGPFAHLLPPLCVYSSERDRERIGEILRSEGLRMIYWQSDEATRRNFQRLQEKTGAGR